MYVLVLCLTCHRAYTSHHNKSVYKKSVYCIACVPGKDQ